MNKASIANLLQQSTSQANSLTEPIKSARANLHRWALKDSPEQKRRNIIVTGHQLDFFHCGIIAKEKQASEIAQSHNGIALSLVLDHDPHSLNFDFPYVLNYNLEQRISTYRFFLGNIFLNNAKLTGSTRDKWLRILKKLQTNIQRYLPENTLAQAINSIEILKENAKEGVDLVDYVVSSRMADLSRNNFSINPIKTSELCKTESWNIFVESILRDADRFRKIYNKAVRSYRTTHSIKNHAQPVPDLASNELPFWIIDKNGQSRSKLYTEAPINDHIMKSHIMPRAITLSLFVRLFLSDIFIHGKGGEKYDQVTNAIIEEFYGIPVLPFLVKSADIYLSPDKNSSLFTIKNLPTLTEWEKQYRFFIYHPETFLPADNELRLQRTQLLLEYKMTQGSKKINRKKLEDNRIDLIKSGHAEHKQLLNTKKKIYRYKRDSLTLHDRTLPYFFHLWAE